MERKGVAAAAAADVCIMLILLSSGQMQQVSAESKISRCYDGCMPDCEQDNSRAICKFFCFTCCVVKRNRNCSRHGESTVDAAAAPAAFAGDGYRKLCMSSTGGDAATGESWATDADNAACADACNSYWIKKKN